METRCPGCQTIFRVTSVQLKARAGKVRCGECQEVFNALDSLIDEIGSVETDGSNPALSTTTTSPPVEATALSTETPIDHDYKIAILHDIFDVAEAPSDELSLQEETLPLSETAAQELGKATGLILPRETTEIPGYSRWAEGVVSTPFSLPEEKATRWPFILAALLLAVGLAGQLVFHFRSEIAVTTPSLRPMLEMLSQALNADLPLPRHAELVSIESSDLQADPAHGNLLVLNATVHNRANYGQAFPSLELSLTDTEDAAIARRVFQPNEYLPEKISAKQAFAAKSDVAVRLWIEAKDISAAGYRLYVFSP